MWVFLCQNRVYWISSTSAPCQQSLVSHFRRHNKHLNFDKCFMGTALLTRYSYEFDNLLMLKFYDNFISTCQNIIIYLIEFRLWNNTMSFNISMFRRTLYCISIGCPKVHKRFYYRGLSCMKRKGRWNEERKLPSKGQIYVLIIYWTKEKEKHWHSERGRG